MASKIRITSDHLVSKSLMSGCVRQSVKLMACFCDVLNSIVFFVTDRSKNDPGPCLYRVTLKEMDMVPKKLIMFDYDGVIVDSQEVFANAFLSACRASGYAGIQTHEQLMTLLEGNFYESLTNLGLPKEKIDKILSGAFEREVLKHADQVAPFDGMLESLKNLSLHHVLTVITSNVSDVVWQFFSRHEITFFEDVAGADIDPSKVRKIQAFMSRYPSLPAYYIGDTKGDMIEGKAAGAMTVAVTWGWHTADKLAEAAPDHMVHAPVELERLLA